MTTQGNKCPICLKLFDDPRWMPCKHIYCFKCIPHLHRRDLDTKDQIVIECRICARQHCFSDWSTVKYYATLHCIPYLTALQFDHTSTSPTTKSSCSACFNVNREDLNDGQLEYCNHCKKNICHECYIDHRMELKKHILHTFDQCRILIRKNQQHTEQTMNKLENMKLHIDACAFELNDQVAAYNDSLLTQIDEQKLHEESNSSSGYESFSEQRLFDVDHETNQEEKLQRNVRLTETLVIPICLLGELISLDSNLSTSFVSHRLWTMTCSFHPSHLVFEPHSSRLIICNDQGYASVYHYNTSHLSLVDKFHLSHDKETYPINIKSFTASASSLMVIFHSPIESILHFYSHSGLLLRSLSFSNEYINQIRFYNNHLWCLELISSSIFYFKLHPDNNIADQLLDKTRFISFREQTFNPFRFAVNQSFVAIMDRATTSTILLFDKQTSLYLKQLQFPLIDVAPCDIELTNQMLIYRFPHTIVLTKLDNEQYIERIDVNKNINIARSRSDDEVLISTSTDDHNAFIIQCYGK